MRELRKLGLFDGKWFSHDLQLLSDMKYELGAGGFERTARWAWSTNIVPASI